MKKIAPLIAALGLTLSLSACGAAPEPSPPPESEPSALVSGLELLAPAPELPTELRGLTSAVLSGFGDADIAAPPESLPKLESLLTGAIETFASSCPFSAELRLGLEDGSERTLAMAEDSCCVFCLDGRYYQYYGYDNGEFYSLFGVEAMESAPPAFTLYSDGEEVELSGAPLSSRIWTAEGWLCGDGKTPDAPAATVSQASELTIGSTHDRLSATVYDESGAYYNYFDDFSAASLTVGYGAGLYKLVVDAADYGRYIPGEDEFELEITRYIFSLEATESSFPCSHRELGTGLIESEEAPVSVLFARKGGVSFEVTGEDAERIWTLLRQSTAESVKAPYHYEVPSFTPFCTLTLSYADGTEELVFSGELPGGAYWYRWLPRGEAAEPPYARGWPQGLPRLVEELEADTVGVFDG